MTYQRQRRSAAPQEPPVRTDEDGDRVYTEEDYAVPAEIPDEWAATSAYLPGAMPDEAFLPDEEELPADAPEEAWDWPAEDDYALPGSDSRFACIPDYDPELDEEYLDEELLSDEERAELHRSRWQLAAGMADFIGVILGTAAILVLITLLVSLLNWLTADISQSFVLLQTKF